MALLQVDPGGERLVPFAKRKLAQWKAQMRAVGVASWSKVIQVSDGSRIYINSLYLGAGQFRDRIRITGTAVPAVCLFSIGDAYECSGAVVNTYEMVIDSFVDGVLTGRIRAVQRRGNAVIYTSAEQSCSYAVQGVGDDAQETFARGPTAAIDGAIRGGVSPGTVTRRSRQSAIGQTSPARR